MKTAIKDYFTFTQRDRRGIFWLLFIVLLLIIFRLSRHWLPPYENDYSAKITSLIHEIEARRDSVLQAEFKYTQLVSLDCEKMNQVNPSFGSSDKSEKKIETRESSKKDMSFFNPNLLDRLGWVNLGFSDRQVDVIMNFQKNGGVYYQKEDVARLYCVDDKKYAELEPWIRIAEEINSKIDLNAADTTELKTLRGIGSYYSTKIVEHRDALGGYHSFQQLFDIWKMRPETVELIQKHCVLDVKDLKKLNINSVSIEELKSHSYFDWNLANAVISYRDQHGRFGSWADFENVRLLDEQTRIKLKPYIGFDD